jgi:hypothetical protein
MLLSEAVGLALLFMTDHLLSWYETVVMYFV